MKRCRDCKFMGYTYKPPIYSFKQEVCFHNSFKSGYDPIDGEQLYKYGDCYKLNKDVNCELFESKVKRKWYKIWREK